MDDLVTEEENQAATDHICRIVRGLTKDPTTRIHASVGGGRKTMGIGLTVAMQLFGRSQDSLSHVLVASEYESHQQFYYPRPRPEILTDRDGKSITASPWVSVSDIAYIRLGGVLSGWLSDDAFSYNQLVERMQEELDVRSGKLRLNLAEESILLASRSIPLPDRQFFVYVLLALFCFRTEGKGFLRLADLRREHFQEALRLIAPSRNPESFRNDEKITVESANEIPGYDFIERWLELIKDRDILKLDTHFGQIRSKVNRELRRQGLPEHFHIRKRGKKANAAYGLVVPPALLTLIKPRQG